LINFLWHLLKKRNQIKLKKSLEKKLF